MSLLGWTLKPQTKRGVCLALMVGQLRGEGGELPEFSRDVSSSKGEHGGSRTFLWDSIASDEAILVRGARSRTWHPESGVQQEFLGSYPPAHAHSSLTIALTDCQPTFLVSPSPHLVPGWSPDPCGPCRQICPGHQRRGCFWEQRTWSQLL